ncbi:unnamed protein product [Caenorhabditis brenneri]
MNFLLLVLILSVAAVNGDRYLPQLNMCANPPKATETLSEALRLPFLNYKISGSVSDWFMQETWMIKETVTRDFAVLERQKNGYQEKWIRDFKGDEQIMFTNSSAPTVCNGNATKPNLINPELFDRISGPDTTSINALVNGLVSFTTKNKGFFLPDTVEVVGGINTKTWVSCIEGNDSKVLLEVRLASFDSLDPASSSFHKPLLLSFRIAEMTSFDSTISRNHWSVELDRYETPVGDEGSIPSGVYCDARNESILKLKPLDEYSANLNYINHAKGTSDVIEVFYSKSRQQLILAGNSFENLLNQEYPEDTDYILHDFKYGYEFTMSNGACADFFELPEKTNDVLLKVKENNTFFLQNPMEYTIVPAYIVWSRYRESKEYIDMKGMDYVKTTIWELRLTLDKEIHSYKVYDLTTHKLLTSMTVNKVEKSRLSTNSVQVSSCYDDGTPGNNTLILPIRNKNLVDMKRVGLSRLNEALQKTINKNVHSVIPYRVTVQYMVNEHNVLSLVLRIAEKSVIEPSTVDGYNYENELEAVEVIGLIRTALMKNKMPIEVETVDGPETWITDSSSIKPSPTPSIVEITETTTEAENELRLKCILLFMLAILIVIAGMVATWAAVNIMLNYKPEKRQMQYNLMNSLEYQKY